MRSLRDAGPSPPAATHGIPHPDPLNPRCCYSLNVNDPVDGESLRKSNAELLDDLAIYADDPTVREDSRNLAAEWRRLLDRARLRAEASLRIALVAQVGRGKSTLLSAMSGLTLAGDGNPLSWAVLPVGSGRTTLGDIRILPRPGFDNIRVTVEPLSKQEILEETRLLAEDAWRVAHGVDRSTTSPVAGSELTKILRSWLCPGQASADARKAIMASAKASESAEAFSDDMQVRLELADPESFQELIPHTVEGMRRLKDVLLKTNSGQFRHGFAPRSVTIETPTFPEGRSLAELVDTQGIDSGATDLLLSARQDLQAIRDDPDTLVVVCTEFEAAPDDVSRIALGWIGGHDSSAPMDFRPPSLVVVDRRDKTGLEADAMRDDADEKMEQCGDLLREDRRTDDIDFTHPASLICLDARSQREKARAHVVGLAAYVHSVRKNIWEQLISKVRVGVPSLGLKEAGLRGKRARLDLLLWRTWDAAVSEKQVGANHARGPLELLASVLDVSMQHWSHLNATVRRRGLYRKLNLSVLASSAASFVSTVPIRHAAAKISSLSLDQYPSLDEPQIREHLQLRQATFQSSAELYRRSLYEAWQRVLVSYFLSPESNDLWRDSISRWGAGHGYVDEVKSYLVRASVSSQLRIPASELPEEPESNLPGRPNLFWLDEVVVTNFRGLAEGRISLGAMTVIVGDNGEGKTAWLEAIASLLEQLLVVLVGEEHGRQHGKFDVRRVAEVRGGEVTLRDVLPLEVIGSGRIQGQETEWRRVQTEVGEAAASADRGGATALASQLRRDALDEALSNLPVFAYYGTGRLWRREANFDDHALNAALSGYGNCLAAGVSLDVVLAKLRQWTFAELQKKTSVPQLRAVRKAVANCVEGVSDFFHDIQLGTPVLVFDNGEVKSLDVLSDGFRNIVAMVADLAWRASSLNPHLGESAPDLAEGVVMIDEVDLHLHPRWQRTILQSLRESFGRIQFVVTTHSPFVVQSAFSDVVVNLNPDLAEHASQSASPEDITEEILGVEVPQRSARREELARVAEAYYKLLEAQPDADSETLRRTRDKLDELEMPYANDVAFVSFLRRKRLEAGLEG